MSNKTYFFANFLEKIAQDDSINEFINGAEQRYHIKAYCIKEITPDEARRLYDSINSKFYKNSNHSKCSNWFENQLRLFAWIVICYCHLNKKKIQSLGPEDWAYFLKIFQHKDPKLFEYQCHCFYLDNKNKNWQRDEQTLLRQIMSNYSAGHYKVKWNQVSKKLFQLSNKNYLRTPKQCRERWNNHLDPSKVKGNWKLEEYVKMFQFVKKNGKKWASLVKVLDNVRNQHSIKNKFNSMVKKHEKLKRQDKKQLTQQQLYTQIIAKVQSALRNTRNGHQHAEIDFDYQQQEMKPQKKPVQQKKAQSYVQNIMLKLKKFGSQPPKKLQQVKKQEQIPTQKIIKQNKLTNEQKQQKISYSNNSIQDQYGQQQQQYQQDEYNENENENDDNYNQQQQYSYENINNQNHMVNFNYQNMNRIQQQRLLPPSRINTFYNPQKQLIKKSVYILKQEQNKNKKQEQILTSNNLPFSQQNNKLTHNFIHKWPTDQIDPDDSD